MKIHTHTPEAIIRKKMFGVTRGRQDSIPGFHSEVRKIGLIGKFHSGIQIGS